MTTIDTPNRAIAIEESTERFEEAMTVIRTAWTTEGRFSHHGKRCHYEDIMLEPQPVQTNTSSVSSASKSRILLLIYNTTTYNRVVLVI